MTLLCFIHGECDRTFSYRFKIILTLISFSRLGFGLYFTEGSNFLETIMDILLFFFLKNQRHLKAHCAEENETDK